VKKVHQRGAGVARLPREGDFNAALPKSRLPREEIFTFI
jgi:hypothetical protein